MINRRRRCSMRGSAFDQQNPAKPGDQRFSERFNTLTASLVYLGSLRIGCRHGLSCDRSAPNRPDRRHRRLRSPRARGEASKGRHLAQVRALIRNCSLLTPCPVSDAVFSREITVFVRIVFNTQIASSTRCGNRHRKLVVAAAALLVACCPPLLLEWRALFVGRSRRRPP
jgi:hypothetical protein